MEGAIEACLRGHHDHQASEHDQGNNNQYPEANDAVAISSFEITKWTWKCSSCIRRLDRKSTRLNSSHSGESRMPSSA